MIMYGEKVRTSRERRSFPKEEYGFLAVEDARQKENFPSTAFYDFSKDFRPCSILEADDSSLRLQKSTKAERVLGLLRSDGEDRSSKLQKKDYTGNGNDSFSKYDWIIFASDTTIPSFETERSSSPAPPAMKQDKVQATVAQIDPWKTTIYKHGPFRSNADIEAASFSNLASWGGLWSPMSYSEDTWADEIVDYYAPIFDPVQEPSTWFDESPDYMKAPVLDMKLIRSIAGR